MNRGYLLHRVPFEVKCGGRLAPFDSVQHGAFLVSLKNSRSADPTGIYQLKKKLDGTWSTESLAKCEGLAGDSIDLRIRDGHIELKHHIPDHDVAVCSLTMNATVQILDEDAYIIDELHVI